MNGLNAAKNGFEKLFMHFDDYDIVMDTQPPVLDVEVEDSAI